MNFLFFLPQLPSINNTHQQPNMSTNPFESDSMEADKNNPFSSGFASKDKDSIRNTHRELKSPPNESQWNSSKRNQQCNVEQQLRERNRSSPLQSQQRSESLRFAEKDDKDKQNHQTLGERTGHDNGDDYSNYRRTQRQQTKQRSRYRPGIDDDNDNEGDGEDAYAATRFADEDGERQMEKIKQDIRNVKQDTLDSTRNALQTINATQESGGQTLASLNEQAGQIANIDRDMGTAKEQVDEAAQKTRYLKRLNRSIFLPAWKNPFNKKARERQKREQEQLAHVDAMDERDQARQFEYQSQARMQRTQQRMNESGASSSSRSRSQSDRNRYQFEADAEDEAMEDEIDQNLSLLSGATKNLKQMASTMNEEIDSQNKHLDKVVDKVNPVNERIFSTTQQLNRIK
ncbi:hypothetical protein BDB00DRAFT_211325 [Zychaea mexicana]|uniref:uncharacterized protein n=1 Tax=Zychaea mexicana TaxID=64656 RepID=UPI0022FEA28B|nr:uncharacterized protein BDB00DRAFT_211325 [Zychaea mexicana]KAI9495702.1 hypothetical protein BDB00DRAFT_211325 [Zychaea mexicana]